METEFIWPADPPRSPLGEWCFTPHSTEQETLLWFPGMSCRWFPTCRRSPICSISSLKCSIFLLMVKLGSVELYSWRLPLVKAARRREGQRSHPHRKRMSCMNILTHTFKSLKIFEHIFIQKMTWCGIFDPALVQNNICKHSGLGNCQYVKQRKNINMIIWNRTSSFLGKHWKTLFVSVRTTYRF